MKKKIRSTSLSFFNKSLFLFFSINVLLCNFSYAQCDLTVDAGPDQMECTVPTTFQLVGSVSDTSLPFEWSPTTGLSNPNSLTPNATVSTTTTYTLTGKSIDYSADLIINGDFSGGDTGFSTDYSYNASPSFPFNELVEGQYSIGNDPAPMHVNWESCGDHTTGTGNMMNVNGSEFANQNAWCQTINVTPNTEYAFSAWVTSVDPNGPCEIQFNINGLAVGDGNIGLSNTCEWINFFVLWNSGTNTTAEVCIEDVNLAEFGNDFAIDDIVFAPTCTVTDEVTLTVSELTAFADSEHLLCSGETLNLTVSSPTGNSFEWSGPTGFTASGTSVSIPNITTLQQGSYTVTVANSDGCVIEANTAVAILESNEVESTEYTCELSEVGTFTQDLTNIFGCDSIVTLTVSLADSDLFEFTETSCDPADVGVFTQNLSNQFGCDSTIITTVSLDESNYINLSETSCDPNDVGIFTQDLINQFGCDSIVTTTVSLDQSSLINLSDTSCNPADVGVFIQDLSNQFGCDSTVITTITLSPNSTTNLTTTTCDAAGVGVFTQDLSNQFGCDSTVITTVVLGTSMPIILFSTTCEASEVGTFTQDLIDQYGCDSIVITNVTLLQSHLINLSTSTCDPDEVGVFTQDLMNQFGCDSTVITDVILDPSTVINLSDTSCDPNEVGTFTQDLINQFGCDSTVITTVSLIPSITVNLSTMSCNPNEVGVFTQDLTGESGCDSIVITTVTLGQNPPVNLSVTTCDPDEVGVFTQNLTDQLGCDSTVITVVSLNPSSLINLTETSCDPDEVGTFTQDLINQYGCDSTVITTVSLDPSSLINLTETSCDPGEVGTFTQDLVNQFGCDSIVVTTVELLQSDEVNISEFTCDEASTGVFTQDLINQFGCDSIVTTTVLLSTFDECGVEMIVEEGVIPCGETSSSLTIIATVGEAPFSYTWSGVSSGSGTISALNVEELINNLPGGNYTIELSSANGFITSAQVTITQNFPPSVSATAASAYNGVEISCAGGNDGAASVQITGGTAPFQIAWSNGEDSTTISQLVAGNYNVTVIDANGCSDTSELNLTEPEPLGLMFSINDIDCFEQSTGAIYTSLTGGISPYSFSLNDGDFQSLGDFTDLSAGNYEVIAIDANGCYSAEVLAINSALQVDVDLGEDLSIEFGEGITLNAIVNIPYDSIVSVVWTAADSLDCPECFIQAVSPIISSTYAVNVVSTDGCPGEDIMTVYVDQEKHIYIPNAFSPNNDGVNDEFLIFARDDEVKNIKMLSVFSRWGENVAEFFDIQPNDINFGWNGKYKGELLDPAVFSWVTVIEFKDGTEQIFKGDVTLLR